MQCPLWSFFSPLSLSLSFFFLFVSLSLQGFFSSPINLPFYYVLSWLKHLLRTDNRRGELMIYFKRKIRLNVWRLTLTSVNTSWKCVWMGLSMCTACHWARSQGLGVLKCQRTLSSSTLYFVDEQSEPQQSWCPIWEHVVSWCQSLDLNPNIMELILCSLNLISFLGDLFQQLKALDNDIYHVFLNRGQMLHGFRSQ